MEGVERVGARGRSGHRKRSGVTAGSPPISRSPRGRRPSRIVAGARQGRVCIAATVRRKSVAGTDDGAGPRVKGGRRVELTHPIPRGHMARRSASEVARTGRVSGTLSGRGCADDRILRARDVFIARRRAVTPLPAQAESQAKGHAASRMTNEANGGFTSGAPRRTARPALVVGAREPLTRHLDWGRCSDAARQFHWGKDGKPWFGIPP
jgi:hypothetical protein